jgi:hypothetical protein
VNPEVHNRNLPLRYEEIKENINEDEKEEVKLPYKRPCPYKNDSKKNVPPNKSPNKQDPNKQDPSENNCKNFTFADLSFEESKFKLGNFFLENSKFYMKIDGSNSSITDSAITEIPKASKENFETFFNCQNDKQAKQKLKLSPFLRKFIKVTISVEFHSENSLIEFHFECKDKSSRTIFSKVYFGCLNFSWCKSYKKITFNLDKPRTLDFNSKKSFFRLIKQIVYPDWNDACDSIESSSDRVIKKKPKRNTKIKSKIIDSNTLNNKTIDSNTLDNVRELFKGHEEEFTNLKSKLCIASSKIIPNENFIKNMKDCCRGLRYITEGLLNSDEHRDILLEKFQNANRITFSKTLTNQEVLQILEEELFTVKKRIMKKS